MKCENCGNKLEDKAVVGIFGEGPVNDALRDYPIHPDVKHYFCPGESNHNPDSPCFREASKGHHSVYSYIEKVSCF